MVNRIRDSKLDNLDYWEKLQELRLYSQERRRERYMVIFLWKISQGLVSGYDVEFSSDGSRRGRIIVPKTIVRSATSIVKKARERLFGVRGAQIFNLFPANIREMNTQHVDTFKNHLDVFLSSIPDQPTVTGLSLFLVIQLGYES